MASRLNRSAHSRRRTSRNNESVEFPSVETLRPLRNPHPFESYIGAKVITLATLLRRSAAIRHQRMFGMSGVESRAVLRVGTSGPLSLDELADHIAISKSQTSRLVTALVQRRLMVRERNPNHARGVAISLSQEGRIIERALKEAAVMRNHELTEGIDPKLLTVASGLLDTMAQRARQLLKRDQERPGPGPDQEAPIDDTDEI